MKMVNSNVYLEYVHTTLGKLKDRKVYWKRNLKKLNYMRIICLIFKLKLVFVKIGVMCSVDVT